MGKELIISAKKLSKTYVTGPVAVEALKKAEIAINKGEFVSIMGPSGSGKSTLLHQLGLLDRPTSGQLYLDGVDVLSLSSQQRTYYRLHHLGYVFQEYALLHELTALENVSIPARMLGLPEEEYLKRSLRILKKLGLSDRAHHRPSELSGGEQQRIAVARALVNEPKIVFADEPTANLDTENSVKIIELFKEINKKTGQTIVMVTHEHSLGERAERTIWLKDGVVQKTSP